MNHFHLNRRTFAALAALSGASVVAPVLWAQPRLEKTKISIAVDGKAAFYYLPLTIAEQLGYFKAEGLEVEISDFSDGSRALQAVVGGSADVVSGAYEHTINLQSKGQMFQAFVLQGRAPAISMGISPKTMPRYKTVADLKGKKIGISAPGSSTNMVANLILSGAGLKPGDVSFIGVGTAAGALSAWRSGQLDALVDRLKIEGIRQRLVQEILEHTSDELVERPHRLKAIGYTDIPPVKCPDFENSHAFPRML